MPLFKLTWTEDDTRWLLPYYALALAYSDLGSGSSAESFDMLGPGGASTIAGAAKLIDAACYVNVVPTSDSGDTTGLNVSIGDDDVDDILEEADLIGGSTGWQMLGDYASGFYPGIVETDYDPHVTLDPQGAGSEDLDDIDAGELVAVLWYRRMPDGDTFYDQLKL